MKSLPSKNHIYWVSLLLAVITFAAYCRVLSSQFITVYDDGSYILKNLNVQKGLTPESISWAFTSTYAYNWHPLTWISHMLDCQLYGLNPAGHHATSLLLHIASTVLLFLALTRMTRRMWPSAFVAALFAIHPVHVESVAWVAERKDVLSTLFWMLTLWTYARYIERRTIGRYALMALSFALGLMSKPMLVTLPFVLLMLDYWPLGRFNRVEAKSKKTLTPWPGWGLIREKIPLFALTVGSSAITYYAQQHGGAVRSLSEFPITVRIANGLVACMAYIGKMVWPTKLSVLYPHPGTGLPVWAVLGSALVLVGVTVLALRMARQRPYLIVGWLWYVVTLIPVIGLVQVGDQAMANRYTYVPLIGLFMVIAWGVSESVGVWECGSKGVKQAPILPLLASLIIAVLTAATWVQVGHWHDGVALFDYAVKSTRNNTTAIGNLGWAYFDRDDWKTAGKYFARALKLNPGLYDMHYGLGVSYSKAGKYDAAIKEYTEALRLKPDSNAVRTELDKVMNRDRGAQENGATSADFQQATEHFDRAVMADQQGNTGLAIREFKEAIRIKPDFAEAYCQLGVTMKNQGNLAGAIEQYRKAIKLKPSLTQAYNNLAVVYYSQGQYAQAWKEVHMAEKYGYTPQQGFLDALSQCMPDPAR